jgi:hypothetical protein
MRQLTIYCSSDEESRVITALDHAGVPGFFRIGDGSGNRFVDPGQVPRTFAWEAVMIVVPTTSEEKIRAVTDELAKYTHSCDIDPCVRIVASEAEELL